MPIDPVSPFVTNLDRPVFALRGLPEEVCAVLFARYSRSTGTLRDNLRQLLDEGDLAGGASEASPVLALAADKAAAFHDKWVVGYGHSSVAEHAIVHLAVEDISIVATKVIENLRLGSYTEKSTRYVPFDKDSYVREPAIAAVPEFAERYDATCRALLGTYAQWLPKVQAYAQSMLAKPDDWTDARYASVCRSRACDCVRYLLPAATRTNLGMTLNARALEHLLSKMFSHPLGEMRALAAAIKTEAAQIVPTLLKYAQENDYLRDAPAAAAKLASDWLLDEPDAPTSNGVTLVSVPREPVVDLVTAILYEASRLDFASVRAQVASWSAERRSQVLRAYLDGRGPHDAPLRALEHLNYQFEITLDYGAYRDIQRHRLCCQTTQTLGTSEGYETPSEVVALGLDGEYARLMDESAATHAVLAAQFGDEAAQYALPLAWRRRVLISWNLRELHHFISLRSGRQGHRSYRRIAQECWRLIAAADPEIASFIRVDLNDYDWARA